MTSIGIVGETGITDIEAEAIVEVLSVGTGGVEPAGSIDEGVASPACFTDLDDFVVSDAGEAALPCVGGWEAARCEGFSNVREGLIMEAGIRIGCVFNLNKIES